MLIPIPKIDSNYRTENIPTGKIQYCTTLHQTLCHSFKVVKLQEPLINTWMSYILSIPCSSWNWLNWDITLSMFLAVRTHLLFRQYCFFKPLPQFLFLSRKDLQMLQSPKVHTGHSPHRCFLFQSDGNFHVNCITHTNILPCSSDSWYFDFCEIRLCVVCFFAANSSSETYDVSMCKCIHA